MEAINCPCGVTYTPSDKSAIRRHEATAKHQKGVAAANAGDGWSLEEAIPHRAYPATFEELDESDAAKAFTEDERIQIQNQINGSVGVLDPTIPPDQFARDYVNHVVRDTPDINKDVLDDLHTYAESVVVLLRADAAGSEPDVEPDVEGPPDATTTKRAAKAASAKIKAAKPKHDHAPKGKKECRVCHEVKPLTAFRVKSSRPDGRDTLCADCAKAWLVAHRAKAAAPAKGAKAKAAAK